MPLIETVHPLESFVVAVPGADCRIGPVETIPHWKSGSRLALGLCTLALPMVAAVIAVGTLAGGVDPPAGLLAAAVGLFVTNAIVVFLYVAFAGQNPRLYSPFAWQMAFIFAGPVALPVYWVIHVWGAPRFRRSYRDPLAG